MTHTLGAMTPEHCAIKNAKTVPTVVAISEMLNSREK